MDRNVKRLTRYIQQVFLCFISLCRSMYCFQRYAFVCLFFYFFRFFCLRSKTDRFIIFTLLFNSFHTLNLYIQYSCSAHKLFLFARNNFYGCIEQRKTINSKKKPQLTSNSSKKRENMSHTINLVR